MILCRSFCVRIANIKVLFDVSVILVGDLSSVDLFATEEAKSLPVLFQGLPCLLIQPQCSFQLTPSVHHFAHSVLDKCFDFVFWFCDTDLFVESYK